MREVIGWSIVIFILLSFIIAAIVLLLQSGWYHTDRKLESPASLFLKLIFFRNSTYKNNNVMVIKYLKWLTILILMVLFILLVGYLSYSAN